jgi:hypothetical protein
LFRNNGSREKAMPTYQYWNENNVGTYVQENYAFMDRLFSRHGDTLRDSLVNAPDENTLRARMNAAVPHLAIPSNVRVGVLDLQSAKYKDWTIDTKAETYYIMVLPPNPQRTPQSSQTTYIDDQEWTNAWYHAVVDGYGM